MPSASPRPTPGHAREPRGGRDRSPVGEARREAATKSLQRPREAAASAEPVDHHGDASGGAPQPPREDRAG